MKKFFETEKTDGFDVMLDYESYKTFIESRRFKRNAVLFAAVAAVLTVLSLFNRWLNCDLDSVYVKSRDYPFSVMVFEVGCGSCALIRSGETNILVDCGQELGEVEILKELYYMNVEELDLVILTHPDKDHIGTMTDVIMNMDVKRFVTCENGDYELNELYDDLISSVESKGLKAEYVRGGDEISFGDLSIEVVSPTHVYSDTNNNSVAVRVLYEEFSVLMMGDAGQEAERDILQNGTDIKSDVLIVGHHGSSGSSSEEFLAAADPDYAVISVAQTDSLPGDKALKRLIGCGCKILRTDESGNILVAVGSDEVCHIFTERGDINENAKGRSN